jgi:DUF1009 family protein
MATTERIGLIAGNGRFPLLFAAAARRVGVEVVAVAHQHETPDEIANLVAQLTWVRVGELGKIIRTFKDAGVKRAVMAGGIRKPRQLSDFRPDLRGAAFIAKTRSLRDDVLLRGVAAELEHDGITVVESTLFLGDLVPQAGTLTRKAPRTREWEDVRFGLEVAREIGRFEVGPERRREAPHRDRRGGHRGHRRGDPPRRRARTRRCRGREGQQARAGPSLRRARPSA